MQKLAIFVLIKAAQGFAVPAKRDRKAYDCTPQPEIRGERRAGQKGPFMDGHLRSLKALPW